MIYFKVYFQNPSLQIPIRHTFVVKQEEQAVKPLVQY